MKERIILLIFVITFFYIPFLYVSDKLDFEHQRHPTTWAGQPGYYGKLHPGHGWYTFYNKQGNAIASLPSGEAFHLH